LYLSHILDELEKVNLLKMELIKMAEWKQHELAKEGLGR
jgi:hypothetical protein